jgi:hypothetical protein
MPGGPGRWKFAEVLAAIDEPEAAGQALESAMSMTRSAWLDGAVGDDRALDARDDGLHVGFVEAEDGGAVKRDAIDELHEGVLNLLERGNGRDARDRWW